MKKILIAGAVLILLLISVTLFPESYQKLEQVFTPFFSKQNASKQAMQNGQSTNKDNLDQEQINRFLQEKIMTMAANQSPFGEKLSEEERQQIINESLEELYTAEHELTRELAVMTLGAFHSPDAKKGILFALDDPDAIVRQQAVIQIRKWANESERLEMLLVALANDDPDIILMTLQYIPNVHDKRLIDRLHLLISGGNEKISAAAKMALPTKE